MWKEQLLENSKKRIVVVAILLADAENATSTVAKSAYYRSAIMLTCTIVESLVYLLVKKHAAQKGDVFSKKVLYKKRHTLPASLTGGRDLVIAEKIEQFQSVDSSDVTFDRLNHYLLNSHLVTKGQFTKLDYTRRERNKLHLQGLQTSDTGYTRAKFITVSEPLAFMIEKAGLR